MTKPRLLVVDAEGLRPYTPGLHRLERDIDYPIADGADRFTIDHGEAYDAFFSALGDARFLLAVGPGGHDDVRGILGGVFRRSVVRGRDVRTAYACDMKLARSERGTGLARRMLFFALGKLITQPDFRGWKIAFAGSMRGDKGDAWRSVRGFHPGKLAKPLVRLHVYFEKAETLARLSVERAPPPPDPSTGIDFSPPPTALEASRPSRALAVPFGPGLVSTAGRKDLRLRSTGRPWPLVHLSRGPSAWTPTWGHYLRACGEALVASPDHPGAIACFAIDDRLSDHADWLARAGVEPGAVCTVYALVLPGARGPVRWVHLATSEI